MNRGGNFPAVVAQNHTLSRDWQIISSIQSFWSKFALNVQLKNVNRHELSKHSDCLPSDIIMRLAIGANCRDVCNSQTVTS